jgi:NADPH-dependent curcumin reductase CurA
MTRTIVGREVRLARRPVGWPEPADFEIVHAATPHVEKGQLLVRNLVMSVDPYMRNRMNAIRSYVPAYKLGHALEGGAVGRVVQAETDKVSPGTLVVHDLGWRDYAVVEADQVTSVGTSASQKGIHLGVLGMPGLTAYAGIVHVANVQPGETVFVSSAAGAVGLVAGQVAKLRGAAKVIGSTGNSAKAELLVSSYGFGAALNYRDGPIDSQLRRIAPEGIDVYLDNVGGDHLEAAIAMMNPHGRIAACGMISRYNSTDLDIGPRNIMQVIAKRITLRGYIIDDYARERDTNLRQLAEWIGDGSLKYSEATVEGLSNAPNALLDLMRGKHFGKVLVKIAD